METNEILKQYENEINWAHLAEIAAKYDPRVDERLDGFNYAAEKARLDAIYLDENGNFRYTDADTYSDYGAEIAALEERQKAALERKTAIERLKIARPEGEAKQFARPFSSERQSENVTYEPYEQPYEPPQHLFHSPAELSTEDYWAEEFAAAYSEEIRYMAATDQWLRYDGEAWRIVSSVEMLKMLDEKMKASLSWLLDNECQFFMVEYHKESERDDPDNIEKARKTLQSLNNKMLGSRTQKNVVEKLKTKANLMIPTGVDPFDRDPYQIPLKSQVYDARKNELRKSTWQDYFSGSFSVDPDPSIKLDEWHENAFWKEHMPNIWSTFYGLDYDEDKINALQGLCAETVLGTNLDALFVVMYGAGRSGKSTFINLLMHVLDDYGQPLDKKNIIRGHDSRHAQEIALIRGKRMSSTSEIKEYELLDSGVIKKLTGGDIIQANLMHHNSESFISTATPWITANESFKIDARDDAVWERIKSIQWVNTIPSDKRKGDFWRQQLSEAPIFMSWILEGVRKIMDFGLSIPKSVDDDALQYRYEQDELIGWAQDCLQEDSNMNCTSSSVLESYKKWCSDMNIKYPTYNAKTLKAAILKQFPNVESKRTKAGVFYMGLHIIA